MAEDPTTDELTEQMFAAVGRAITQWSFVEDRLCSLFSVCVGSAVSSKHGGIEFIESWIPMWVFYAAESFNTKRALVDAAIAAVLYRGPQAGELKAEWATLSDKARKLSHKRNKLAHWTVFPAQRSGSGAGHDSIHPARLMPPFGSPKYWRETGLSPLGLSLSEVKVGHIDKAFYLYCGKVSDFTKKVAGNLELRDTNARRALRLLESDDRLSPTLLASLKRELSLK